MYNFIGCLIHKAYRARIEITGYYARTGRIMPMLNNHRDRIFYSDCFCSNCGVNIPARQVRVQHEFRALCLLCSGGVFKISIPPMNGVN